MDERIYIYVNIKTKKYCVKLNYVLYKNISVVLELSYEKMSARVLEFIFTEFSLLIKVYLINDDFVFNLYVAL